MRAIEVFDDGSGSALYVGGSFRASDGNPGDRIAKWDGSSWAPLGRGMSYTVMSLAVFNDGPGPSLYAGGAFTRAGDRMSANGVARWDGHEWSTLASGVSSTQLGGHSVAALCVFDDGSGPALYAGGRFEEAGGIAVRNVAKWNGRQWTALGDGIEGYEVRDFAAYDDGSGSSLYAAGATWPRIAKWTGQAWEAVGGDVNEPAHSLVVYNDGSGDALFAGGQFTWAGGVHAVRMAKWDGSAWSSIATHADGDVWALEVFNDGSEPGIYVGGGFSAAGMLQARYIARWDAAWSSLGAGVSGSLGPIVLGLRVFDDGAGSALYVGGQFARAGSVDANCIARWTCENCYADCDRGGSLNIFDFLCFQDAFVTGSSYADCTGEGVLNVLDLLCFQDMFVAGCG